jgi:phage terminase Nu1 subunit (DNA packaging protein)
VAIDDVVGRDDIAELMGVDTRTVNVWAQQGMPKIARGKYRIRDCVQWYVARISAERGGGDLHDEKKKLVVQQRQRVELENARARGELLPIADLEELLNRVGVIIATQLDGLAPRTAAKLATLDDPVVIQGYMFDECRTIRTAISAEFTSLASDRVAIADRRASAKPKRRAMGGRGKGSAA